MSGWGEPPGLFGLFGVHAALWRDGAVIDLGTLGGTLSRARGINADGVVVGSATSPGDFFFNAFMWRDGVMTDLGVGSGDAFGIDPTGRIVGRRGSFSAGFRAFLWDQGTVTDLGTLGGNNAAAYAINPAGVIVGSSLTAEGAEHAFRWQNGTMTDLGTLGGTKSVAYAINPAGDIVGSSTTAAGEEHAVLWPKGGSEIVDLGTSGRPGSVATGINPSGQIVGYVAGPPAADPFIWQRGVMTLLPAALTDPAEVNPRSPAHAFAIDPAGNVVGDGRTFMSTHAALWTRK